MKKYDPEGLNDAYNDKSRLLYQKQHSQYPKHIEQYFDTRHSVIRFTDAQRKDLRDAFEKFDEQNVGVIEPVKLKQEFLKYGYDKSSPPLFSMLSWIADASAYAEEVEALARCVLFGRDEAVRSLLRCIEL